jgi:hypothetical protein
MKGVIPDEIRGRQAQTSFESHVVFRAREALPSIANLFGGARWEAAPYINQAVARSLAHAFPGSTKWRDADVLLRIAMLEHWLRAVRHCSG